MHQIAAQAAQTPQAELLAPAAVIGAVVATAMIVLKIIDYWLSRDTRSDLASLGDRIVGAIEDSLEPLSERVTRIDVEATRTRETVDQLWAMHDSYDADGKPKWFSPSDLCSVLRQVSQTCERIVDTQARIIESQNVMVDTLRQMQERQTEMARILERMRE